MSPRLALLRHLWSMVQTRAEAATLVVKLQRTAVTQGLMLYGIAAVAAMSFTTALIALVAVGAPPAWRVPVLGLLTAALLATAIYGIVSAGRKFTRDANLIADFSRGLKLDLAMINLALESAETEDEEKVEKRERAKAAVREAAAEKAATPSTAEGGVSPASDGPAMNATSAAMHAASPAVASDDARPIEDGGAYATTADSSPELPSGATEREMPEPPITTPESMTTPPTRREKVSHGST